MATNLIKKKELDIKNVFLYLFYDDLRRWHFILKLLTEISCAIV